jgi:beta-1,4-mannooligosaccharide/beta-1,4-mannosyl-N-acetylglucosamine phosphorylase
MESDEPFTRVGNKPVLTPDDLPFKGNAVYNPGVLTLDDEVILLIRVEDRQGISQIYVARSANGVDQWHIEKKPLLASDQPEYPYEEWGCEDPRVTRISERMWLIVYVAYSRYGPAVALATTEDFVSVKRLGIALSPVNKDAAVISENLDGRWMMLHRPVTGGQQHIWYAMGNHDFTCWSHPGILLVERGGPWWDGLRIGCGAPPIRTEHGWLLLYHGAKEMGQRPLYRLGAALLDLHNPRKVLARASSWIFAPEAYYERQGLVPGVVFTCGAVPRGDELWMYYGAADTVVGLATAKISNVVQFVLDHDYLKKIGREKGTIC